MFRNHHRAESEVLKESILAANIIDLIWINEHFVKSEDVTSLW